MSEDINVLQRHGYQKLGTFSDRIKSSAKKKGVPHVIGVAGRVAFGLLMSWLICYGVCKPFKSKRTFTLQGKVYHYFYHWYNNAWKNERTVEIPIVIGVVRNYRGRRILEVGNVLSHYIAADHDILDKYEMQGGVINQDIIEFQPAKKYDLIVSISTLEHVGWDESPREPLKILKALEHLENLLAPQGRMVVTLPVGYNPVLDKLIDEDKIRFSDIYYLKRTTKSNSWVEVKKDKTKNAKYGYPFVSANALIVGIIEKK